MKSIYFLSLNMIAFVPYAFGFLKSYAQQDPAVAAAYRWHPPFSTPEPVDAIVAAIVDPDLLCLSCYVWNHNQQMEIARQVKARYPDCRVVCGGPHVPDHPGNFFERFPQSDILVHGDGPRPPIPVDRKRPPGLCRRRHRLFLPLFKVQALFSSAGHHARICISTRRKGSGVGMTTEQAKRYTWPGNNRSSNYM